MMRIGMAADHGGFALKAGLMEAFRSAGCDVVDFGAHRLVPEDDYPDFVIPLARAVARGELVRGVAICGSGVGACVAANKAPGARAQRVLWASTSTKNPRYSDVKYVEALIGPETINTLPPETLDAYRDHGRPSPRLEEHLESAEEVLLHLAELDIDIDAVTRQLETEGVEKFNKPYDSLMEKLRKARADALA